MTINKDTKILIIGLGVMGGSYAKALTEKGYNVSCITKDASDIEYAVKNDIIKQGTTELDKDLIGSADLIVFALYPSVFIEWVKENQHLFKSGALITDVTGVKGNIVEKVQSILRNDIEFISAHPMAGREASGVRFSDPTVFKGANYIVTPTEKNTADAIETCKELGRILGFSRISELSPEKHDKMIAFLSQLTHCIAVSLMNSVSEDGLEKYTGDSFRDLTRIAKINDKMWAELFIMNKEVLISEMDKFLEEFKAFKKMIEEKDESSLRQKMRISTERRKLFDKPKN